MKKSKKPKITAKQEGGDDGHCWVVRLDGHVFVRGLTRAEVPYYKRQAKQRWCECTIGRTFARLLKESLGDQTVRSIAYANRGEPDSAICHSHDYCDANEYMLAAFQEVMGRDPYMPCDVGSIAEAEIEKDQRLWDHAWNHATKHDFWFLS